ncbi:hypothetical protein NEAUS06_0362 [Nematocida ausubeli]|nr:hypothetical protein NEAUS06_0362 [Nematocida ausubeli]
MDGISIEGVSMETFKIIGFLVIAVVLHYLIYKPNVLEKIYKDAKRHRVLLEYKSAESYYQSIKIENNPEDNDSLLGNKLFMASFAKIKEKLLHQREADLLNMDIETLVHEINEYEEWILNEKRNHAMIEQFYLMRHAYLNEYMFIVMNVIRKKQTKEFLHLEEVNKTISLITRKLEAQDISNSSRAEYLETIRNLHLAVNHLTTDKVKEEIERYEMLKRIGELEGHLLYLELFRTLPDISPNKSKEFKNRIFRLHIISQMNNLSNKWSIFFGKVIEPTAMNQLVA